jgi:hypothetical protein
MGKLTFQKDRFPAIAGLAREFADRTGYHYMAGIWAEDFRRGLLWEGVVPESYNGLGPSWSWVEAEYDWRSGKLYESHRFMRHGLEFAAELVSFSDPKAADAFLEGGGATILTLRELCKGFGEFRAGQQFYQFSLSSKLGKEPATTKLHLRHSPFSNHSGDEDTVSIWPDNEMNNTTAMRILVEKQAVVLRISEFETWDAGSPHVFTTYGLLLEPAVSPNGTYQRIGLVGIPRGTPATSIEGYDLQTISIA